ncbi:Hypothetical predicted protein [Mytilus galloprovincialis]|uniref:NodB homology domain-containing protein n=2 Tax=Mytilus galloprovincialis TaxID=29158 RepID=A0A8B6GIL0_MYTGA|nr:Hypothetical predicted protein [Mytilus galloprovincialis]
MMELQFTLTALFVFVFFLEISAYTPNACTRCQNTNTCKPPNCVCCSNDMPLPYKEIPQMVFFTFDDAITPQVAGFYRQLFDSSRRNPNGCPVSMTLFISHSNTVYSLVREFYQKGFEIASHSVSHGHPKTSTFKDEALKQKQNLARMARIPHTRIKGWRSPFLEPLGDAQPNMLHELGYSYDATLTISKKTLKEKPPVPFTLDYGWPYDCKIKPCPRKQHRGFWEVPVISLMDYLQRFDCVYVDGCNNPPPDEEAAFRFLWDNFQSYYKTNKAPFGINMHASWFFYPDRLKAMDRFIRELTRLDDVYVVSVKQVIEWLRNPVKLQDVSSFGPWSCINANGNGTGSQTAFDLRNKQIEQRLQELRHERYVKQETDFLQRHHTWNMQQAAKKAASAKLSQYPNYQQRTPQTRFYAQQHPIVSSGRTSSAMTWQQMLVAHSRKQHAQSRPRYAQQSHRPGFSPRVGINLNVPQVRPPPAPKRMIRPVGKNNDPRRKQIMLKERKRIREQQRIAAENRLKQTIKLQDANSNVPTPIIISVSDSNSNKIVSNVPRKHFQTRTNINMNYERRVLAPINNVILKPAKHIQTQNGVSKSGNYVNVPKRKQLSRRQMTLNEEIKSVPKFVHRKPVETVISKPNLHDSVQTPVKRERIKPKPSPKKSVQSVVSPGTEKPKRKYYSAPNVQMIGGSWNLFNMKNSDMKIPWRSWITETRKDRRIENKTKVQAKIINSDVKIKDKNLKKTKTQQMMSPKEWKNDTIQTEILSTKAPSISKTIKPINSSKANMTVVENIVKPDINLTHSGQETSTPALNNCQQNVNCFLPDCLCMTNKNAFEIKRNEIPQIVYITFEGDINFLSYSKMRSLFKSQRINPNGCPISPTFFVSESGSSYSLARNLQRYGTEIAMHGSKTHHIDKASLTSDIDKQIQNFVQRIGNQGRSLTGWRNPDLKILGDEQFEFFKNKSIYDSSLVLDRSMKAFPFTLDFGLEKHCKDMNVCQLNGHQGIWEVPIIPLFGFNQSEPCLYADECSSQPTNTKETYQYLLKNFEKYYHNNRAPFGLHLKQNWFHWSSSKNLAGLSKFLDTILEYNDVYIVTISDMIEWLKKPTKISDISKTNIWNC